MCGCGRVVKNAILPRKQLAFDLSFWEEIYVIPDRKSLLGWELVIPERPIMRSRMGTLNHTVPLNLGTEFIYIGHESINHDNAMNGWDIEAQADFPG